MKLSKIQDINVFHATHFAYLLERLKSVKEGDGNLLDHSMIVYGSGIGDGNAHNHDELPILLAGKGSGTIKPGRHAGRDLTVVSAVVWWLLRHDTRTYRRHCQCCDGPKSARYQRGAFLPRSSLTG